MSDRILRAFMQLFAIVANTDEVGQNGRALVERFLRWQLPRKLVDQYLLEYDHFLAALKERVEDGKVRKRTSVNSVKVLRICSEINKELEQKQKVIVLVRLYEFIHNAAGVFTTQHQEFLDTVAEVFSINFADRDDCKAMATGAGLEERVHNGRLHASKSDGGEDSLPAGLFVLIFNDPVLMLLRYAGAEQLTLDGREIQPGVVMVCEPGSVIRGPKISPVYYNDIISSRRSGDSEVLYEVKELSYSFGNGKTALHPLTFSAHSGQLIGIMGNSGAGKTTLLNLLNGTLAPGGGVININGQRTDRGVGAWQSVIGNVPQDDLLIEELTVFQNLYFSSKLYFGSLDEASLIRKVDACLEQLQLMEARNLKVGDPLNKFISGGQRKRLNIALELIREPEVLFVDEPTSGLSSSDSENVMDLLKQQALSGRLVFVVIHQPSSSIYKLFDELLVLDTGGYPAYYGNPVDALGYFRQQMEYANYESSECTECGNIDPEELFTIINAKTVDEFGKPTVNRKFSPDEWYRLFLQHAARQPDTSYSRNALSVHHQVAGKFKQFAVYFKRNLLAKLQNVQYMSITLLEAPLLALILGFTLRSTGKGGSYHFGDNPNIPAYLFISTIVALFLGLITSAEEIIQDRRILMRETFLRLSRQSYLLSKLSYLFLVSAVQAALFVAIGDLILEVPGSRFSSFLMLFSVSCLGNLLGLNISAALRTRVAVYILIPFLVIPQIMFSGVLVRFDELNPSMTNASQVPLVGNVMATRWAFEGLATKQFVENGYERNFFKTDQALNNVVYRKDTWLTIMQEQTKAAHNNAAMQQLLFQEFSKACNEFPDFHTPVPGACTDASFEATGFRTDLDSMKSYLLNKYRLLTQSKEELKEQLLATCGGTEGLDRLKHANRNEQLADLVMNMNSFKGSALTTDGIVRRYKPVYTDARSGSMLDAPFYAAEKSVFGVTLSTFQVNVMVLWLMSLLLYVLLYLDVLRKLVEKQLFRS